MWLKKGNSFYFKCDWLYSTTPINLENGKHNKSIGYFHKYFADAIIQFWNMVSLWQKEITIF